MVAPWLVAGFAFLFHLGRELLKDLEDSAGDRQLPGSTTAIAWGEPCTRVLITGIFALLIGVYGPVYLGLIIALDILLIFVLIRLWQRELNFLSHLLKAGMVLGLAAFLFAKP